jgi:hypothetical protein
MASCYEEILRDKPDLIFIFTDGETDWPATAPIPTTAIIVNEREGVMDDVPSHIRKVYVNSD